MCSSTALYLWSQKGNILYLIESFIFDGKYARSSSYFEISLKLVMSLLLWVQTHKKFIIYQSKDVNEIEIMLNEELRSICLESVITN